MSRHEYSPARLLQAFSSMTLELQRLAQNQDLANFHRPALDCVGQVLPFASAWWGRAALIDGLPEEHSSYLHGLPASYLPDWQSIRHIDVTVGRVHAHPGQSVIIDMRDPDNGPGLNWLGQAYGIGELLCVVHVDPRTLLSDHLALYRAPGAPRFTEQDRLILDNAMLHLVAAVSANQIRTLVTKRESLSPSRNLALAVCDQRGTLQCAERGFVDLLLGEWPQWSGPLLPMAVDGRGHEGKHLQIEASAVGDLFLLAARPRGALAQLSPREQDVALGFGEGKTYKEIARDLGMAPNTVRHHIRAIYHKLGVNDKTRIAQLLHTPPD
ncbi:helix-turn-helix transcriptional regulator [Pseudomonas sp. GD04058]|uniref:helix-turn-helix transcriptional regulator n=1 Tax=Pseudomonas sp. GD04058 TaxID=2975429 RepID=UPI002446A21A|nr:helix-turn-helix transcriptional regulator [Pseudomonas sp. GD04058]MDG9882356.1 helix-turn-helix transcriptional regulator [Pseudomonas sp. GD04058]